MKTQVVKKLFYNVVADKESYEKATKLEKDYPNFKFILDNFVLEIILYKAYFSESEARSDVEPILKNWETYLDLVGERNELRFKYSRAEIVETELETRNEKQIISVSSTAVLSCSVNVKIITHRSKYPKPPDNFTLSPDVSSLWQRFNNSLDGKEPILSMAYFCLTLVLEKGKRNMVSNKGNVFKKISPLFNIEEAVLKKISELTSTSGDLNEARKINNSSRLNKLDSNERAWLISALKKIILRIGEYDFNPNANFHKIEMNQLPPLK